MVSLPVPPNMTTDPGTVPLIAKKFDEEEPEAFSVSLPAPAIRKSGLPLLPVRLIAAPEAPKIVTDPVPLFTVALVAVLSANTIPPAPAVIDAVPVPPRIVAVVPANTTWPAFVTELKA